MQIYAQVQAHDLFDNQHPSYNYVHDDFQYDDNDGDDDDDNRGGNGTEVELSRLSC